MVPLFVFLPSHVLLAYSSGPMPRSLAVILDQEVSFRMEARHQESGVKRKEASVLDDTVELPFQSVPNYLQPSFLWGKKKFYFV